MTESTAGRTLFRIVEKRIDAAGLQALLADPGAGACCVFEGWVRDHHQGRAVTGLDYEAYVALAETEGLAIVSDVLARFAVTAVVCEHRIGSLAIGDLAVWVGISAGHRDAAFAACRHVIDEVKARVPIWKREHYIDQPAAWLHPVAES